MRYGILGPLELDDAGRAVEIPGAKQRALLAVLLLNANRVVSSDALIDALWEEQAPETAAKALHVHISQLRKLLDSGRLVTRSPGYLLEVGEDELDLHQFEALVERARESAPVAASAVLREALSLWRGRPLADFAFARFAQTEIGRLEELRLVALEDRFEAELALGLHRELIGELESLVAEHPLRERLRGLLMLTLYRSGRQAEALEAYQATRAALVDELGIEPGRELRELHQQILRQDRSLDFVDRQPSPVEPTRGAFVGREPELAELVAGLDDAFAGRGRLVLLAGEPGIGKSRLAEELITQARARGACVLVGRCWEAGGAPAFWPWVQSLRSYVRETDRATLRVQLGAGAGDLAQILPELREMFPGLPEPSSLESESARFRLFDVMAEFLRNASRSRPIVLALDDLHAADAPSLLLLQFLARELGSARILVLGAYRDVDPIPGQPLAALLADVAREPLARSVLLRGLSEGSVAEYVERTASELASPELVAALHLETEGNPLFVGETVRLLSLEGVRPGPAGRTIAIPQSVRDVIVRRLTHLSENCNRLLECASVLGREFTLGTVGRMGAVPGDEELLESLDEAVAARIIVDLPGPGTRLRFTHVLIRDTLYEGLPTARRVRLHRLAGEVLEALYGDERGPHLAELAHHAIAGSDYDNAVRFARLAGDRALALLAYEEAARLYETALGALELADAPDEPSRCEFLLLRGEAEIRAGDTPAAKETFVAAAEVARRLGLANELARAAAGYGGRIVWARADDDPRLVPLLEEGLAALAAEDAELRARLLARLSGALRDEPSRARRDALSQEAVDLARRTGNLAVLTHALVGRAHAIIAPDTVAECLALGTELHEVAVRSGDREQIVAAHMLRNMAHLVVGDVPDGTIDLAAATRIAGELKQPAQLWLVRSAQAMMALAAGRLDEAEALIPQALELGERALPRVAIPHDRLQRYALSDLRGDPAELEPEIQDLVIAYPARVIFRCVLAHLQARLGRRPAAKRALDDLAGKDFSALPFDQEWLFGMSLLAETAALAGDTDSAGVLYRLLLPWAAFNAVDVAEGFRGAVSRYLGLLATTAGSPDEAVRHFEDALELNGRMGARPWLAHTQHDYGRMLLSHGGQRDHERGRELLDQALITYRELGAQGHAARVQALNA